LVRVGLWSAVRWLLRVLGGRVWLGRIVGMVIAWRHRTLRMPMRRMPVLRSPLRLRRVASCRGMRGTVGGRVVMGRIWLAIVFIMALRGAVVVSTTAIVMATASSSVMPSSTLAMLRV
jgi:hypothetical protein